MNRTYLVMIFVAIIAVNVAVSSVVIQSQIRKANTAILQTDADQTKPAQLVKSTSRLIYHSKMVVVETLTITKHSVNVMFEAAIKTL